MSFSKIKFQATVALFSTVFLFSCIKEDAFFNTDTDESKRKQIVKIMGADESLVQRARDVLPTLDTFLLIDLRREPKSQAELNTPLTVKLIRNSALISSYNTANNTNFIELPASSYTLLTDINSITFQPGEFVKEIRIRLNKTSLSLSQSYALGFSIAEVGAGGQISNDMKNVLYAVGIKNKWDGLYAVTGSFSDVTNAAFTGAYPLNWELQTNGPTSCVVVDNENLGFPGFLFYTGTGYSYYGNFGLIVNFDPATNAITSVTNFYGQPASNTRSAQLDPTGANRYDEATKTISIKYFMLQPSAVAAPPHIRARFDETWRYTGPR
jgi:hypothetical protein